MSKKVKMKINEVYTLTPVYSFTTKHPVDLVRKWIKEQEEKQGDNHSEFPDLTPNKPDRWDDHPLFTSFSVQECSYSSEKLPKYLEGNECRFDEEIQEWIDTTNPILKSKTEKNER